MKNIHKEFQKLSAQEEEENFTMGDMRRILRSKGLPENMVSSRKANRMAIRKGLMDPPSKNDTPQNQGLEKELRKRYDEIPVIDSDTYKSLCDKQDLTDIEKQSIQKYKRQMYFKIPVTYDIVKMFSKHETHILNTLDLVSSRESGKEIQSIKDMYTQMGWTDYTVSQSPVRSVVFDSKINTPISEINRILADHTGCELQIQNKKTPNGKTLVMYTLVAPKYLELVKYMTSSPLATP